MWVCYRRECEVKCKSLIFIICAFLSCMNVSNFHSVTNYYFSNNPHLKFVYSGKFLRSTLIRSQSAGKVCAESADRKTKWEWKLRNYSVELKFSTIHRGMVWWQSKSWEKRKTVNGRICNFWCNWSAVATMRTIVSISKEEIRKPSFFESVMIRETLWHDPWECLRHVIK